MTTAGIEKIVKRPRRWDDWTMIERKKRLKREHRFQAMSFTAKLHRAGLRLALVGLEVRP